MNLEPVILQISERLAFSRRFRARLLPSTAWAVGELLSGLPSEAQEQALRKLHRTAQPYCARRQLLVMLRLYRCFSAPGQVSDRLYWGHYRLLCTLGEAEARQFYHHSALQFQWSIRTLRRQMQSRYYERHGQGAGPLPQHYVLEFAASAAEPWPPDSERSLEAALISRLQHFLLELGDQFAFVARQKRLVTESGKAFYVDLVFYHISLKCFVLFDLKIGELSHRDVGQLDFYVRFFDHHFRLPGDAPTIGLLLCRAQDQTLVRYSMLHDNPQLWSATYQLHLPTAAELTAALKA